MQISFFEEFPTPENLSKAKYLQWPTKLYLAAPDLRAFETIKKKIKNKNVTQIIYWPTLSQKEGYWISPLADRKALLRIFGELWGKTIPLMLDLEVPPLINVKLYLQALNHFKVNKLLIRNFINNYRGPIYLAEYFPEGRWKEKMLDWWGLHYNNDQARVIKMMYQSMHHFSEKAFKKECKLGVQLHGQKFCLALGTIAVGINGREPLLSGLQLKRDLLTAKHAGVSESIIFRLGGLETTHQRSISEVLENETDFVDIKQFVKKAQPATVEIVVAADHSKDKRTKLDYQK